jgi:hypothetical protein
MTSTAPQLTTVQAAVSARGVKGLVIQANTVVWNPGHEQQVLVLVLRVGKCC